MSRRIISLCIIIPFLSLLLAGCGQKGALFLAPKSAIATSSSTPKKAPDAAVSASDNK